MVTPDDGWIELIIWDKLPIIDEVEGRVEGMTQVDAYLIPNEETKSYNTAREEVRNAITMHYEKMKSVLKKVVSVCRMENTL